MLVYAPTTLVFVTASVKQFAIQIGYNYTLNKLFKFTNQLEFLFEQQSTIELLNMPYIQAVPTF